MRDRETISTAASQTSKNALVTLVPVDLDVEADEAERVGLGRRSGSVQRDGRLSMRPSQRAVSLLKGTPSSP